MARGGYLGGSTIIHAGSSWFSKPKSPKILTEAESSKREKVKAEKEKRSAAKQALAKRRAKKRKNRRKTADAEARQERAVAARELQEEFERRKNDPQFQLLLAERRRKKAERLRKKEEERTSKFIVEVRKRKRFRADLGPGSN